MNIHLHIERLILDGLSLEATHGSAVQAAVEAELTRLLAEGGLPPSFQQGGALAYARGVKIHYIQHNTPKHLGEKIGQAVYGGLDQ